MADIGQARCVNLTQHDRQFTGTVVVPVEDTQLWPASEIEAGVLTVSVRDALPISSPGTTQRCQGYVQGPLYRSGNPRYVRMVFKGEIAGGVSGHSLFGSVYSRYAENTVTFTNDATAGVPYAVHADIIDALSRTSFQVDVPLEGGTRNMFHLLTEAIAGRQGFNIEPDQNANANAIITAWRSLWRDFPPPFNSRPQPSYWTELFFEIPSGMREVTWWLNIGSHLFDPAGAGQPPKGHTAPEYTHEQSYGNWLCRVSHTADAELAVFGESVKLPQAPTVNVDNTVLTVADTSDAWQRTWPKAMTMALHGKLLYTAGTPTALESSTLDAERTGLPVEIISLNWGDHGTWPVTGELPRRPNNSLISTDDEGRVQAAKFANDQWTALQGHRHPGWWDPPAGIDGWEASPTGGPAEWGYQHFWPAARSGQPDFRAWRIGAMQAGFRAYDFRTAELDIARYNDNVLPPPTHPFHPNNNRVVWSGCQMWDLRLDHRDANWTSGWVNQMNIDGVGPIEPGNFQVGASSTRPGAIGRTWSRPDKQHAEIRQLPRFALVTGDRWARQRLTIEEQCLMNNLWGYVDLEALAGSPPGSPSWNIWRGKYGPQYERAEGRLLNSIVECYSVTGTAEVQQFFQDRYFNIVGPNGENRYDLFNRGETLPSGRESIQAAWFGIQKGGSFGQCCNPVITREPWMIQFTAMAYYGIWLAINGRNTANHFFQLARRMMRSVTMHQVRNNSESGNVWQLVHGVNHDDHYGQGEIGVAPDAADMRLTQPGQAGNNPFNIWPGDCGVCQTNNCCADGRWLRNSQGRFFLSGNGLQQIQWGHASIIKGYELARMVGDQGWINQAIAILNGPGNIMPTEESQRGPYGWGKYDGDSFSRWAQVVDDPYKSRNASVVVGDLELQGSTSLSMTGFADPEVSESILLQGQTTLNMAGGAFTPPGPPVRNGVATLAGSTSLSMSGKVVTEHQGAAELIGATTFTVSGEVVDVGSIAVGRIGLIGILETRQTFEVIKDMANVNVVFEMHAGDDMVLDFFVRTRDGAAVDLSTATQITWILRRDIGTATLISKSLTGGGVVKLNQNDPDFTGHFEIRLDDTDTETLSGRYYHELEIQFSGSTHTVATGRALIEPAALLP